MKYHFFILCSLLLNIFCALEAKGQTVKWELPPVTTYSSIQPLGAHDLFLVTVKDKKGIIKADGTVVVRAENDEVTPFYEGKALVIKQDGYGQRIAGFINKKGNYVVLANRYYVIEGQHFFSDGLLTAINEFKFPGYLDELGREVLGFNSLFDVVMPFTEGYAVVKKRDSYSLIDKRGKALRIIFKKVGETMFGCTNVYNGTAYVWNKEGRFFTFDINTQTPCKKARRPRSTALDYLHRFSAVTGIGKEVMYDSIPSSAMGLPPTVEDGKLGYTEGGLTLIPAQFDYASPFINNLAVVEKEGRRGILRYVREGLFEIKVPHLGNVNYSFAEAETTCSIQVSLPEVWKGESLQVIVKTPAKEEGATAFPQGNYYVFPLATKGDTRKTCEVTIMSEGVKLYTDRVMIYLTACCPACHQPVTKCTYQGKHPSTRKSSSKKKGKKPKGKICPDCGLPENRCPYGGVH